MDHYHRPCNGWGMFDMRGNVSEFIQDDAFLSAAEEVVFNPGGEKLGRDSDCRGGNIGCSVGMMNCGEIDALARVRTIGFRVALGPIAAPTK